MARGWESKAVATQQEEQGGKRGKNSGEPAPAAIDHSKERRRKVLMLAKARTAADLKKATAPAQREMLERALADLERTIGEL
jgi:hypothetical protein